MSCKNPKGLVGSAVFAAGLTALAGIAAAQDHSQHKKGMGPFVNSPLITSAAAQEVAGPQLWDNLGSLTYPVTTASPEAQKYFDQGLRLSYAFNHAEAIRAFRHAQQFDPSCALCYWGEALAHGPNINAPMFAEAVAPALEAVAKAQDAANGASPKEKALIAALATRYSDAQDADRAALDAAYADAMAKLAKEHPDDLDLNVLAVEAMMDTQPWDYWEGASGAKTPKGRGADIVATLERVLKANPEHAGAIHLYIHAMENSDAPAKAEPYADRLAAQMPGAGHLVHMPGHIYYRVGRYLDSLKANIEAVAVDEAFLAKVADNGVYRGGYYPHNVHFVMTSAQMAGDAKAAVDAAGKLAAVIDDEVAATFAWVQPVKAAPFFAHAQYGDPDTTLAMPDPGDRFPYVKGAWHYARGVAFAQKRDIASAVAEAEAIDKIANEADLSFLLTNFVPADQLLQIARHIVLARIAQNKGYASTAIDEFQHAVNLQDGLPYTEPPYWYYPVRQSLGAALLKAGRNEEAAEAFRASLKEAPNNGWAIFGLKEAQKALGDAAGAKASEESLTKAWAGAPEFLDLSKL